MPDNTSLLGELGNLHAALGALAAEVARLGSDLELVKLELFSVSAFIEQRAPSALPRLRAELKAVLSLAQGLRRAYAKWEKREEDRPFEGAKIFV